MSLSWSQVDPLMLAQGEQVLRRLEDSGFAAYFVGGCVRDEIMGRPVHDMDIATSARPEQVMEIFERTVPTGLQHGTVTVVLEGNPFEVTTFRKETVYVDHRRPAGVEFVDGIEEDLLRRDFTMNAMARDLRGRIVDPYGGQRDIQRGWIRCVGRAEERFEEDALRMMRAIRFASVFGFRLVKSLWRGLQSQRDGFSFIAVERIRAELERIVAGPQPLRGLAFLDRSGLLQALKAPVPRHKPGTLITYLERLPITAPELRWSLLLQSLGCSGDDARELMRSWTFPNVVADTVAAILDFDAQIVSQASLIIEESAEEESDPAFDQLRRCWTRLQVEYGQAIAGLWLRREAVIYGGNSLEAGPSIYVHSLLLRKGQDWYRQVQVQELKDLAVTGGDVLTVLERRGGPWLGKLMKELLHAVAAGDIPNERETLLMEAKERVHDE
ncbi:CCA tRNA nucleotidyltransferase [Paenibacillus sp. CAA11]|uniref:CCA tRNA nucleotidyltransferase n=1 Tax=Paenibacillus sp. CAA11 TaxID=1532905 RepID=UPI001F2A817D|nr:CCA tRNA nucleotidyltransferase [Paenibacillus sp. CAA11]